MKSPEYLRGFQAGRENAEAFHKGTRNARERKLATLSPYSKLTEPEKAKAWRRGYLDGDADYWKGKPSIEVWI